MNLCPISNTNEKREYEHTSQRAKIIVFDGPKQGGAFDVLRFYFFAPNLVKKHFLTTPKTTSGTLLFFLGSQPDPNSGIGSRTTSGPLRVTMITSKYLHVMGIPFFCVCGRCIFGTLKCIETVFV